MHIPELNSIEILLLIIVSLITFAYLTWNYKNIKRAGLATLVLIPIFSISVDRVTTFLTIDEEFVMAQVTELGTLPLPALQTTWFRGDARTTIGIFGPIVPALHKLMPTTSHEVKHMILKGLHWLLAMLVFIPMHHLLDRYAIPEKSRLYFVPLFFSIALLLPTNSLAIKTFSYDGLSLTLGMLAFVLIYVALRNSSGRYALLAVMVASLAAQEKPIAAPVLLIAIPVFANLQASGQAIGKRIIKLAIYTVVGIVVYALTGFATILVVAFMRGWNGFGLLAQSLLYPLISWLLPFLMSSNASFDASVDQRLPSLLVPGLLITFAACAVAAGLLNAIRAKRFTERLLKLGGRILPQISIAMLVMLVILGLIGLFGVDAYISTPSKQIPDDLYREITVQTGHQRYYSASSRLEHSIRHTAFTAGLMVGAIPTVVWLLVGLAIASVIRRTSMGDQKAMVAAHLALIMGASFPLLYGILNAPYSIPPSARYFNIGVFILVLGVLVWSTETITILRFDRAVALSGICLLLLVLELVPFSPLLISFRPVWFNLPTTRNDDAELGVVDPVWSGWGEDTMLAGRWLEAHCNGSTSAVRVETDIVAEQPCSELRLYGVYPGVWLDSESLIERPVTFHDPFSFTSYDYYVFNRTSITTERVIDPNKVEPIYVLRFRGYAQAWIYQGDDLARAGYAFSGD